MNSIILNVGDLITPGLIEDLQGSTFQVTVLPNNQIQLHRVSIVNDLRCPVVIGGERCGLSANHEGRHIWSGGD